MYYKTTLNYKLLTFNFITLTKEFLKFLKWVFVVVGRRVHVFAVEQRFHYLLFFFIEFLWSPDVYIDKYVASAVAVEFWKTFASEFYHFSALCSCWHLQFCLAVDDRNFHCRSESGLWETDEEVVEKVFAIAFEFFVFLFFDENNEVAGDAVSCASVTFASH